MFPARLRKGSGSIEKQDVIKAIKAILIKKGLKVDKLQLKWKVR